MTVTQLPDIRPIHPGKPAQGNDNVRRNNLSVILTMLHREGPASRAQLTRRTGLNRSTIGALVSELNELGLAYETIPTSVRRVGRPSPMVHANEKVTAISINPDVDAITVGLVGLGGYLHRRIRYVAATEPTVADTVNITNAIVQGLQVELGSMDRVTGAAVAVPGLVRSAEAHVLLAPHLKWTDESLGELLGHSLGLPVRAANDASLACLAESIFGAAVGSSDVVYLNGSASGIGGGVISGGIALRGFAGYSGELGHTLVKTGGEKCHCGRSGCLDAEVRLERLLAAVGRKRADLEELEQAISKHPSDELRGEVERQIDLLAVAITNFINIFNPEMVVLGGFLGTIFSLDPDRLRAAVSRESIAGLGASVQIHRAKLGRDNYLVGAAELAFSELLTDPARALQPRAL